jgi:bacteriorhodopsin
MYIVVIAWIYVVLMMSITERSVTASIMTFVLYGALPVAIIVYVMGTPHRKRRRAQAENLKQNSAPPRDAATPSGSDTPSQN